MKTLTKGKLFAFELNPHRFQLLARRLNEYKANNVVAKRADYLRAKIPRGIKVAVVDPSCSGSGIISHQLIDHGKLTYNPDYIDHRVKQLSYFQEKVLNNTLVIPGISQVVYSTCSVHKIENENVVETVLSRY